MKMIDLISYGLIKTNNLKFMEKNCIYYYTRIFNAWIHKIYWLNIKNQLTILFINDYL